MKKLSLLLSISVIFVGLQCQIKPGSGKDKKDTTGLTTVGLSSDSLNWQETDTTRSGGKISPNKAPDQAKIDSLKKEKAKRKKNFDHEGGKGN